MLSHKEWPVLFVDDELEFPDIEGQSARGVVQELTEVMGCAVLEAFTCRDGLARFRSNADIGCLVLDWEIHVPEGEIGPLELLREVRSRNEDLPIFLFTDKLAVPDLPLEVLDLMNGYIWKAEDSPEFIAGRIENALSKYVDAIQPPFFRELVKYAEEYKYAWHTPGHMGGVAFRKTPTGRLLWDYFGENVFRSDLSISVPELGSLLDHEGPVKDSEDMAADIFGADKTYYVLNGTSTANQIVWHARVGRDDIALVDRNCHKSLNYAMIVTGAIPLYLKPTRNPYGTIGPIHLDEFEPRTIEKKKRDCPLLPEARRKERVRMSAVTNSTYDGLCYDVRRMKRLLAESVDNLHFDEAWYAYARFHPLYDGHFGMSHAGEGKNHPPVFATQSTHKLLAAWSQASMIHVKDGDEVKVDPVRFNEAYMMHGSTSPQYGMIATLDVGARMMRGKGGAALMNDTLEEAVLFRKKMESMTEEVAHAAPTPGERWWFTAWQPRVAGVDTDTLLADQRIWTLKPGDDWHLFKNIRDHYVMLDPLKVTIATPGINHAGKLDKDGGIPASIVTDFLLTRGVVVEKTGHYSWLVLFSIGITRGKSGTLLAAMLDFKRLYDRNAPMNEVLPDLVREHPERYGSMGLRDLCEEMHQYNRKHRMVDSMLECFDTLPEQVLKPSDAYDSMVRGKAEYVYLEDIRDRVTAVQVVPYPPGIPVIMPGERFTDASKVVTYLENIQAFETVFPGFVSDIHGVEREEPENCAQGGVRRFKILCLTD